MSLRFKSLLIFSAAVTLLFAIVLGLVKIIIERQFTDVEREKMLQQADRFSIDLQDELKSVTSVVGDWAAWDELYDFTEGTNPDFPSRNFNEQILDNLRIDFFAIWRRDASLVQLKTIPGNLGRGQITPETLLNSIKREELVPESKIGQSTTGLIIVGKRIAFVASFPIVHDNRAGPPAGTLVGGRILGAETIESLEKFAGYRFTFIPRQPDHPSAPGAPPPKPATTVRIVDSQTIMAVVPIIDTRGRLIADAELTSARPLHLQAGKTIRIFLIALASSAGILLFVVWYLLDANVIHPVRRLAAKLAEAASRGRLPSDLGVTGVDELAQLARRIEDLAGIVAHAEASYRAVVEDQIDFIFRYHPNGRLTFVNEAFCRYVDRPREQLLGGDAHRIVAEEDIGRVLAAIEQLTPRSQVVTLDHRVLAPGGGTAWFRRTDRAIYSENGDLRELQCVARDVTQTHLTRERLEASEMRYRRLFETATDGILILRHSDRMVTDANPELCRILACDRGLLLERPLESIPAFKSQKTLRSLMKLLDASQQRTDRVEIAIVRDSGTRCFLEAMAGTFEAGGEAIAQIYFRDISLRKRANDELRQLSGHLLRLQDEERRRIARELHDSTAQNLSALQMAATQLEAAIPGLNGKAHSALAEIRTLADLSSREIRTISYLLHPPLLDEVGLIFALRWYVDGFMTRTEKIVRLDMPESLERLQPEIETTVFRVVQEGLSNIHRHSGSRRAWIQLAVESGVLTLSIRDEGKGVGYTPATPQSPTQPVLGVGIAGMRERLRQFGGSLEIESGRGGTTVRATLPIELDESQND